MNHESGNYLTYYNINWEKYLHVFNAYDNIQGIFLIHSSDIKNCLQLGNINDKCILQLYDITSYKINLLNKLGPCIIKKKYTTDFNDNIEKTLIDYFKKNRYLKWIGIIDTIIEDNLYSDNYMKPYMEPYLDPYLDPYMDKSTLNIAYLIPFRDRYQHLEKTISNLNKYIQYHNLDADIWVIEQNQFGNWNKGVTCNIGFDILKKFYQYFVFNDADTYPQLSTNFIYPNKNEINHIYGYEYCLGGIFSCDKNTFIKINGFNNNFFNWGREDRDLEDRCKKHNVTINRSNHIKLNSKNTQVNQLTHDNKYNYWNFKEKNNDFYKSRELYYFNQIEHFKNNYTSGLTNLIMSELTSLCNRKIILTINLKKWTIGTISIINVGKNSILNDKLFDIETYPNIDTGILKIKYNDNVLVMPINPEEKYPKIQIEITNDKNICIRYNYLFDKNFTINNLNSEIYTCVNYTNIEYIDTINFDNIYTPFNNELIKYNYYSIYKKNYYLFNINI